MYGAWGKTAVPLHFPAPRVGTGDLVVNKVVVDDSSGAKTKWRQFGGLPSDLARLLVETELATGAKC